MKERILQEIELVSEQVEKLSSRYRVDEVIPYLWKIYPNSYDPLVMEDKELALSVFGVTHGNELAGLGVVKEFLTLLVSGQIETKLPIMIGLGNPDAARENVRFIDKDLNRSFMNDDETTKEGKRARLLEEHLSETHWFLDLHQTSRHTEEPFFIFPYSKEGYQFARHIDPARAIVTRWDGSFSTEGGCTDEFVNQRGGHGISFELGQNGFDDYQISLGVKACIWALHYATNRILGEPLRDISKESVSGLTYTFARTVDFPENGTPILDEGLFNFKSISEGDVLGDMDGEPLKALATGKLLFPKFIKPGMKLDKRPVELYRVLRVVDPSELELIS